MSIQIYDDISWKTVPETDGYIRIWDDIEWKNVQEVIVWESGEWRVAWKVGGPPGPTPPGPGTYTLDRTAQFISNQIQGTAYAEFDTTRYRGYISELRITISYRSFPNWVLYDIGVRGRPSGTYYREIEDIGQWQGRTIDHRIDTFNSTSLTQFNNGTAIGFTLDTTGNNYRPADYYSQINCKVTVT